MKTTIILASAMAALGLMIVPVSAEDAASKEKPAVEAAAQNTVTVYIVNVKGKGWGVAKRASLAIESQDGVKKILLSGYRATIIMEDGKSLDEENTKKAIEDKGLTMESFAQTDTVIPEAGYVLAVTGTGWAITNDKARVALEKLDNIAGAYVNRGLIIHLAKAGELDKDQVAETLGKFKMTIQDVKPIDGNPY